MSVTIHSLSIENTKRVRAVSLQPAAAGLTVIGGRNGQGKTSVLDAIAWALGGDRFRPSRPERGDSAEPPHLRVQLSNGLLVERSGRRGALKVTDPTGARAGQTLLNEFVGELSLDLPRFLHADSREKAAILLKTLGLDDKLHRLDREEAELYDQRRTVGQLADRKRKHAGELPCWPDVPDQPLSVSTLIERQQQILAQNAENQQKRHRCAALAQQHAALTARLEALRREHADLTARLEAAQAEADACTDESTAPLEADLRSIETINARVRANHEKAQAEAEAAQYDAQYRALTGRIETLRLRRRELLQSAPLPLDGLSVEQGELTFRGCRWDCMSGAEQLRVATAIVRAAKPQCGFVLIDQLEQMDLDTLRDFGSWLEAQGLQAIATRVSTGGECTVLIEDGRALPAPAPQPKPGSAPAPAAVQEVAP